MFLGLRHFDFTYLIFSPFWFFYATSHRYSFREHPTFNIVYFPCKLRIYYEHTWRHVRTDNRVVHHSRLRMRIYQIQVHFEMQFAKRPGNFSRSPGRSRFIQIRRSVVLVLAERYLFRSHKRTNKRMENLRLTRERLSNPGTGSGEINDR